MTFTIRRSIIEVQIRRLTTLNGLRRMITMSSKEDKKLIFTSKVETTEEEMTTIINKLRCNLRRAIGICIDESIKVVANHLDCKKLKPEDVAVLIIASAYANTSNVGEYLEYIHDICNYSEDEIVVMIMTNITLK